MFTPGWHPDHAASARAAMASRGVSYVRADFAGDDRPLPPNFSLSAFRLRHLEQGQVGTCWEHAPTQGGEVMAGAAGLEQVAICRNLVGYQGTVLMAQGGRRRNPSDGGSVTDAFLAMGDKPDGVGICPESLWPYQPSPGSTGAAPPAGVLAAADKVRVHQVAEVAIGDGWKRSIFNGHPVAIGIWWPYGWDTQGATFFSTIGSGVFGHALLVMGWIEYRGVTWWQLDNWHGLLYAPLVPELAETVPGYKPIGPDRTSDFWVEDSTLRSVVNYGSAEMVAAAGLTGFTVKDPLANLAKALAL